MKTTAKLASPGSQLQNLQKSPPQGTLQNTIPTSQVPSVQQPSVSANLQIAQTVNTNPLISTVSSAPPLSVQSNLTAITTAVTTTPQPTTPVVASRSPQKSQVIPSPGKSVHSPPQTSSQQNINNINTTTVPSTVALISPTIQIPSTPPPNSSQASTETPNFEVSSVITKEIETKQLTSSEVKVSAVKQSGEKKPTLASSPKAIQTSSTILKSSTMRLRLATVTTPPRKKPPPTIPKKVTPQTSQQKATQKSATIAPKGEVSAEKSQMTSTKTTPQTPTTKSSNKPEATASNVTPKTKRIRTKVQPYQSPTPELALVTKLSTQIANGGSSNSSKNGEDKDKLTLFYK